MGARLYNTAVLAGIWLLMILGICLNTGAGCASHMTPADPPAVGEAISRAQVHVETAQSHIAAVAPHTAGVDRANLGAAATSLAAGQEDLAEAQRLNRNQNQIIANLTADNVRLTAERDAERAQWFGDKLHHYAAWVVGIGLLLLAAYELIAVWAQGGPLIKGISGLAGLVWNLFRKLG
jgi:hypothetical protein